MRTSMLLLCVALGVGCTDDDRPGAADAAPDPDAAVGPDAAVEPDGGPEVGACGGAVPATPTGDVAYDAWDDTGCFDDACLCSAAAADVVERLLACEPIAGGYFWGLGSAYVRVMGRTGDTCDLRVGLENEGDVEVWACRVPTPLAPWPGLAITHPGLADGEQLIAGLEPYCTSEGHCNVVFGAPHPCADDPELAAPLCPAASSRACR